MRRLAIAALLWALGAPGAAAQSRGLDHRAHARAAAETAGAAVTCASCHPSDAAGRLRGRPGHKTCFSRCHAPMPPPRRPGRAYAIEDSRRPLCLVCHGSGALDDAARGERSRLEAEPPPGDRRDHLLTMSHRTHAATSCADCHRFGRGNRAHDRCRGCHARPPVAAVLAMSACERCHLAPAANRRGLASEPSPYTTGASFSHQRHAPRMGAQASCLSCHAGLDQLAGNKVPRPRKSTCAGCHDGETAFSTTEARCRACHRHEPVPAGERERSESRFDHAVHAGDAVACVACHPGGARFDTSVGHTTCAAEGCHAADYAERDPAVCGTCHLGNEPWLDQHVDRPTRERGDFGVRFDHAQHAAGPERSCQSCHIGDADRPDVGLTSGHAGCEGANCHDSKPPLMSRCDECHGLGARARRQRTAAGRRWSVRRAFRHALHQRGERAKPLPCTACHRPASSRGLMPPPRKAACLGCHDGSPAFKATGHGCIRCHRKSG